MSEKEKIDDSQRRNLLDIFVSDDDKYGYDLLKTSDFFDIYIQNIKTSVKDFSTWERETGINIEDALGEFSSAIKVGYDISQMGTFIADTASLSPKVLKAFKEGKYHLQNSHKVAGDSCANVVDDKGKIVGQLSLKKAVNPSDTLRDISTLSMQFSLQSINFQLDKMRRDLKEIYKFNRREAFDATFFNARDKILSAANASENDCEKLLKDANTYLMEGLSSLYTDVNGQVARLAKQYGIKASIGEINEILGYITEDMLKIQKFVGLRLYLLYYLSLSCNADRQQQLSSDATNTLNAYKKMLIGMEEEKVGRTNHSAFELIHDNFPYTKRNKDFWIKKPKEMIKSLEEHEKFLTQTNGEIFYVDIKDLDNGQEEKES